MPKKPRSYFFRIAIEHATIKDHEGWMPKGFLTDCEQVISDCGIESGEIRGVWSGGRELWFSSNLSAECRQRVRNAWRFCLDQWRPWRV